uniref:Uncharacterized protein n=1 Tax=Candidatus Kentrum sp. DK TaxID=2126562 RepID=A0A450S297_9GAMM|nr:MAG: hypothetical protein BECKDK2373B_GA0170837_101117 [Candidatus Kentron sp. DK]
MGGDPREMGGDPTFSGSQALLGNEKTRKAGAWEPEPKPPGILATTRLPDTPVGSAALLVGKF